MDEVMDEMMCMDQDLRSSCSMPIAWPVADEMVGDLTREGIVRWTSSGKLLGRLFDTLDIQEWPSFLPKKPRSHQEATDVCAFLEKNPCLARQAWFGSYLSVLFSLAVKDLDRYTSEGNTPLMARHSKAVLHEIRNVLYSSSVVDGMEVYIRHLDRSSMATFRAMIPELASGRFSVSLRGHESDGITRR